MMTKLNPLKVIYGYRQLYIKHAILFVTHGIGSIQRQ